MMHMSIPVDNIPFDPDSTEILCAFYYDAARDTWSIVPPAEVDESAGMMTVVTPYKRYWNWGKVRLYEANRDMTLKPLLESIAGDDQISDVEQYITDVYQELVAEDWDATCESVSILRGAFEDLRSQKVANLQVFQDELGGICGPCHLTTSEFMHIMTSRQYATTTV